MSSVVKPLFLVLEGIDGSGKSTQSEMLYNYLSSININCEKLVEPSSGVWGRKIRIILGGNNVPPAEEMLKYFIKDREDDVITNIIPSFEKNRSVVMDRYYYSNAAYQGAMGLSPDDIIDENRSMKFPEPDRVYLIDVNPSTALERLTLRNEGGKADIFEQKSFLEKVRNIYLEIANDRFLIINGEQTPENIFIQIKEDVDKFINNNSR